MSLKRDMAMVNEDFPLSSLFIPFVSICYFPLINPPLLPRRSLNKFLLLRSGPRRLVRI